VIHVAELTKVYRVPVKEPGLMGSLKSLVHRQYKEVRAVDGITFDIADGERIGFLGPNGAGKTTTLKMLTGLLHPTSGRCEVEGYVPQQRSADFLRRITLVMGQKQQLLWDLPAMETFSLNRALYDIPKKAFDESLAELTELLDMKPFLDTPSRNLSLGQRMRAELAAALLHRPKILFLDEPTIGMDVEVQALVRKFVAEYNQRHGATVMLTSHDMQDVASLARRIILIDQGIVRFDGTLEDFQRSFATGRRVVVKCTGEPLEGLGFTRESDEQWLATVAPSEVNRLLGLVLQRVPAAEVTVADPPLEEVLRTAFGEARRAAGGAASA
jgi:ABC-2 type transport system ATP-binding protein